MRVYYNEIDPHCCEWLQNLMDLGAISKGVIDNRSILDVTPSDLRGFTRCHFFSGVGVWDYALNLAGWDDDRPVWTGSCPCQPFSAAGKGGGFADERHLWPAFDWLIAQRRPDVVFGEQVEGPAGRAWLDLVSTDLEGSGYAFGTTVFPSAGVGAPHGRHRTYWLAHSHFATRERNARSLSSTQEGLGRARIVDGDLLVRHCDGRADDELGLSDSGGRLAGRQGSATVGQRRSVVAASGSLDVAIPDQGQRRRRRRSIYGERQRDRQDEGRAQDHGESAGRGGTEFVADDDDEGLERRSGAAERRAQRLAGSRSVAGGVADCTSDGRIEERQVGTGRVERAGTQRESGRIAVSSESCELANSGDSAGQRSEPRAIERRLSTPAWKDVSGQRTGPTNGFWRDADWLFCRDGKWWPVEPETQPLVDGSAFRMGSGGPFEGKHRAKMLAGYGNAINPHQAAEFIRAYLDTETP